MSYCSGITFMCDGRVFDISKHGRMAAGVLMYVDPDIKYSEFPQHSPCILLRRSGETESFISWGRESYMVGGPNEISAVGVPDGLEIRPYDLILIQKPTT